MTAPGGLMRMFFSSVMKIRVINITILSELLTFCHIFFIIIQGCRFVDRCWLPPWRRLDLFFFNIRWRSCCNWLKGLSDVLLNLSSEKGCKFLKVLMGDKIWVRNRIRKWRIGSLSLYICVYMCVCVYNLIIFFKTWLIMVVIISNDFDCSWL